MQRLVSDKIYVIYRLIWLTVYVGFIHALFIDNRDVKNFNAVESSGPFNTTIEVTETEGLTITADVDDENVTAAIQTVVDRGTLRIFFSPPYNKNEDDYLGIIYENP